MEHQISKAKRIASVIIATLMIFAVYSATQFSFVSAATKAPSVTIKGAKSAKAGELKVSWKKSKKAAGYQVVVAKDKKFKKGKKVKSVKKKTTGVTFKKLSKGTKYYAKVRAYKVVKGEKVYGKYSKVKSAKTKGKKATPLYKKVQNKTYYSNSKPGKEFVYVEFKKASSGKIKLRIGNGLDTTDYNLWSNLVTGKVKGNRISFKISKWNSMDWLGNYVSDPINISGTITLVNSKTIKIKTTSRDDQFNDLKLLNPGRTTTLHSK